MKADSSHPFLSSDDPSLLRKRRSQQLRLAAPNNNCSSIPMAEQQTNTQLDDFLQSAYTNSSYSSSDSTVSSKWQTVRRQWNYWCIILSCGIANSSDASEILCLSYILSNDDFAATFLVQEEKEDSGGWLAAAVFFGMLVGGLFLGTMGDWVGRRPILLLGLGCNAVAGLASCLSPNITILSILRCISGIGIGATVPALFTLVTELAPPSHRGFCVTLVASFWMVGSIFVAVTAMVLLEHYQTSWRIFAMVCALPSILGLGLCYHFVPQSPRFLALQQQQHQAALDVAHYLARQMNSSTGTMNAASTLTLEDLKQAFPPQPNTITTTTNNSWWQMMKLAFLDFVASAQNLYTPQLQKTTWPLQMVWFALSFGSYGLVTWINTIFVEVHLQNVYFNALLFAASNLPGNMLSALWLDKVGRGKLLTGSILAASASLLTFAASAFSLYSFGVVASACAFQCFTVMAWNTIDVMTSELFPTTVRSTGMGVCAASGRIGAMVAQLVNGLLVANPVRLLLVASITLLLGALTPSLLPGKGDMTGQPVHDFEDRVGEENEPTTNSSDTTQQQQPLLQEMSYQKDRVEKRKNSIV